MTGHLAKLIRSFDGGSCRTSGRFYGDLLRDRLFGPLGMKTARVISEEEILPHRAAGYRLEKGTLRNQAWVSPSLNTTADGSLYLSILDLVAWDAGVRAKAVLRPESWEAVFTPVKLRSGKTYPYGFGWFVDDQSGQRRHHHSGAWQGFKTYVSRHLGSDLTVMVLANLAQADPGAIVAGVAGLVDPGLAVRTGPIVDREFRYQATFQGGAFELTLGLAPDGKVARFDLARRDPVP